jgi:phosphatidate cytidylyltransferase
MSNNNMLTKRILSGIVIIIIGLALVFAGGWIYTIGLGVILAVAVWEYAHLFEIGNYAPAKITLTIGTFLIALSGQFSDPNYSLGAFSLVILAIIIHHVITYHNHLDTAGFDLAISLGGVAYIAFIGLFLVKLRFLPEGLFWLLQCLLPAGLSDVGAFAIGSLFGRHKIAPQLSPNKTVEGYLGGVATLRTGRRIGRLCAAPIQPHIQQL